MKKSAEHGANNDISFICNKSLKMCALYPAQLRGQSAILPILQEMIHLWINNITVSLVRKIAVQK
jgi:hypothetical protein